MEAFIDRFFNEAGLLAGCLLLAVVGLWRAWANERKSSAEHNSALFTKIMAIAEGATAAQTKTATVLEAIQRDGVRVRS